MEPLFLPDEEENANANSRNTPPSPPPEDIDIDAIFKEFEEEAADDHTTGEAKYKKAPLPKMTQHEILPSSSPPRDLGDDGAKGSSKTDGKKDGDKKEKEETYAVGRSAVVGSYWLSSTDKGYEGFQTERKRARGTYHSTARDLDRLLQVYQFWTHRMYPKSQFSDTVERVEKLCHSKRNDRSAKCMERRGSWKGVPSGAEDDEIIDLTENEGNATDTNHSDAAQYASSSPVPPTRPPSSPDTSGRSAAGADDDDEELDAVMRDLEERRQKELATQNGDKQPSTSRNAPSSTSNGGSMDIDDDDLWAAFDEVHDGGMTTSTTATDSSTVLTSGNASTSMDDDEEMWDVVREMEQAERASSMSKPASQATKELPKQDTGAGVPSSEPGKSTSAPVDDDWEDMYV
ncbi:chromosome segregation in meiosis-related protein [Paramarasmius palmivorus]|uniref:Chromosome segregation in meiosis protein n=1 Tax=Paramarasmius palmivorus TaxID=297713 RepID=A0AAW0DRV6_9AGAR